MKLVRDDSTLTLLRGEFHQNDLASDYPGFALVCSKGKELGLVLKPEDGFELNIHSGDIRQSLKEDGIPQTRIFRVDTLETHVPISWETQATKGKRIADAGIRHIAGVHEKVNISFSDEVAKTERRGG